MRKFILILLVLSISVISSAEVLDKIVAKIVGDIILLSDLQKQMAQMKSAGVREEMIQPREVLDSMIEQRLMIQKAKELNIKVDENAIKGYAERYIKQLKSKYPSEQAFLSELAQMRLTQTDLQKYFVDQITENALTEQLVEKHISARVKLEDTELRAYYEATKDSMAVRPISWDLRMIMREVKASDNSESDKLAIINGILQQLNNGADFATLARETSDCPSSQEGGDLGFFKKGMMVKPFEEAAFKLSVGEISPIVKTQFGYHIIKVEEKKGDEIRARHILKMINANQDDADREMDLMNNLRSTILAGADFSELARQYSMDKESATEGGLIGEFTADEFPELFSETILNTRVGSPTEVLKNEELLYLFIRDKELPSRIYSYEEVKDQLYNFLFRQKQMIAYDEWIEQVKAESYVSITL